MSKEITVYLLHIKQKAWVTYSIVIYTLLSNEKSSIRHIFSCVICNIAHYNILKTLWCPVPLPPPEKTSHWTTLQLGESSHFFNWAHCMGGQYLNTVQILWKSQTVFFFEYIGCLHLVMTQKMSLCILYFSCF